MLSAGHIPEYTGTELGFEHNNTQAAVLEQELSYICVNSRKSLKPNDIVLWERRAFPSFLVR